MQNRSLAVFKSIHDRLRLFLRLVQLGKQAFNAVNDTLLLGEGRERYCSCLYIS